MHRHTIEVHPGEKSFEVADGKNLHEALHEIWPEPGQ